MHRVYAVGIFVFGFFGHCSMQPWNGSLSCSVPCRPLWVPHGNWTLRGDGHSPPKAWYLNTTTAETSVSGQLQSQRFNQTATVDLCVQFYCRVRQPPAGQHNARAAVDVMVVYRGDHNISQHRDSCTNIWMRNQVDVSAKFTPARQGSVSRFRVIIKATLIGSQGSSFGLDDISLDIGRCSDTSVKETPPLETVSVTPLYLTPNNSAVNNTGSAELTSPHSPAGNRTVGHTAPAATSTGHSSHSSVTSPTTVNRQSLSSVAVMWTSGTSALHPFPGTSKHHDENTTASVDPSALSSTVITTVTITATSGPSTTIATENTPTTSSATKPTSTTKATSTSITNTASITTTTTKRTSSTTTITTTPMRTTAAERISIVSVSPRGPESSAETATLAKTSSNPTWKTDAGVSARDATRLPGEQLSSGTGLDATAGVTALRPFVSGRVFSEAESRTEPPRPSQQADDGHSATVELSPSPWTRTLVDTKGPPGFHPTNKVGKDDKPFPVSTTPKSAHSYTTHKEMPFAEREALIISTGSLGFLLLLTLILTATLRFCKGSNAIKRRRKTSSQYDDTSEMADNPAHHFDLTSLYVDLPFGRANARGPATHRDIPTIVVSNHDPDDSDTDVDRSDEDDDEDKYGDNISGKCDVVHPSWSRAVNAGGGKPRVFAPRRGTEPARGTDFHSTEPARGTDFHGTEPTRGTDIHGTEPARTDLYSTEPTRRTDFRSLDPARTDFRSSESARGTAFHTTESARTDFHSLEPARGTDFHGARKRATDYGQNRDLNPLSGRPGTALQSSAFTPVASPSGTSQADLRSSPRAALVPPAWSAAGDVAGLEGDEKKGGTGLWGAPVNRAISAAPAKKDDSVTCGPPPRPGSAVCAQGLQAQDGQTSPERPVKPDPRDEEIYSRVLRSNEKTTSAPRQEESRVTKRGPPPRPPTPPPRTDLAPVVPSGAQSRPPDGRMSNSSETPAPPGSSSPGPLRQRETTLAFSTQDQQRQVRELISQQRLLLQKVANDRFLRQTDGKQKVRSPTVRSLATSPDLRLVGRSAPQLPPSLIGQDGWASLKRPNSDRHPAAELDDPRDSDSSFSSLTSSTGSQASLSVRSASSAASLTNRLAGRGQFQSAGDRVFRDNIVLTAPRRLLQAANSISGISGSGGGPGNQSSAMANSTSGKNDRRLNAEQNSSQGSKVQKMPEDVLRTGSETEKAYSDKKSPGADRSSSDVQESEPSGGTTDWCLKSSNNDKAAAKPELALRSAAAAAIVRSVDGHYIPNPRRNLAWHQGERQATHPAARTTAGRSEAPPSSERRGRGEAASASSSRSTVTASELARADGDRKPLKPMPEGAPHALSDRPRSDQAVRQSSPLSGVKFTLSSSSSSLSLPERITDEKLRSFSDESAEEGEATKGTTPDLGQFLQISVV